jgi:inhibitor of cysteine peptidase
MSSGKNDLERGGVMRLAHIFKKLTIIFMFWSFLIPSLVFLPAVNFPKARGEMDPSEAGLKVFTAASNKGTAPVRVGDTFQVVLEANPSTGYSWHVAGVDTAVLQPGNMEFRPTSGLLGAPEEQIIPFTALRVGQTAVDLVYKRPWEQEMRLQSFMMNVQVTE